MERALWSALRALEEQAAVRRRMAERARMHGMATTADRFQQRAHELDKEAQQVRNLVLAGVGAAEEDVEEPAPEES